MTWREVFAPWMQQIPSAASTSACGSEEHVPAFLPSMCDKWGLQDQGTCRSQSSLLSRSGCLGLGWPFSGTAGAGESCQSHTGFHLLKDLRRKGGGGRDGKVFQCVTSSGCSSEMFHKVFLAPLGASGRVYQPRGSGGVEEGK